MSKQTIFLSAGDPSADKHAAQLMSTLQQHSPEYDFVGMGAVHMRAAGLRCLVDANDLAIVGFVEVCRHYFSLRKAFKTLVAALKQDKPDLLILIDYGAFNLRLAKVAKRLAIPILYYISPQVWASRSGRVKTIKRYIDKVAVIYPFEKAFYRQHDIEVTYVGHPVAQAMLTQDAAVNTNKPFNHEAPTIGLLPGSRVGEIKRILPTMLAAAKRLQEHYPNAQFKLAKADNIDLPLVQQCCQQAKQVNVDIIANDLHHMINQCDVLVATSGTVTLEVTLREKPFVLVYKANRLTAWLAKRLIRIPYLGITNIIANKPIVTELLQAQCSANNIAHEVMKMIQDDNYRQDMVQSLSQIKDVLDVRQAEMTITDVCLQMLAARH